MTFQVGLHAPISGSGSGGAPGALQQPRPGAAAIDGASGGAQLPPELLDPERVKVGFLGQCCGPCSVCVLACFLRSAPLSCLSKHLLHGYCSEATMQLPLSRRSCRT